MAGWWRYLVMMAGGIAIAAPVHVRFDNGSRADLQVISSLALAKPGGGGNGNSGERGNSGGNGNSGNGGKSGDGSNGGAGSAGGGNSAGGNGGTGSSGSTGGGGPNKGGAPSNGGGSANGEGPSGGQGAERGAGGGAGQGNNGGKGQPSGSASESRANGAPGRSGEAPGHSRNASSRADKVSSRTDRKAAKAGKSPNHRKVQKNVKINPAREVEASAPARSVANGQKHKASRGSVSGQDAKVDTTGARGKVATKAVTRETLDRVSAIDAAQRPRSSAVEDAVPAMVDDRLELIGSPTKPRQAPNSIVVSGLSQQDLGRLAALGLQVTSQTRGLIAPRIVRLSVPAGMSLTEAERVVQSVNVGASADADSYYYTDGGELGCDTPGCEASMLVGWTPVEADTCEAPPLIGLIDTGIDLEHEALKGQAIEVLNVSQELRGSSSLDHGTAIAALLVGRPGSTAPGLIPRAKLLAVDAFAKEAGMADRSDVVSLVSALEALADRGVRVINLSLSGPPNEVLKAAIEATLARGIVLVAAVGNNGAAAEPSYPAAYPGVIGVTAVDRQLNVYRRATRGPYVAFAAPGVEIRTAQPAGTSAVRSGTSYAVPFVSAAAAMLLANDTETDAEKLRKALQGTTRDLGAPGRDPTFGFGLVQMTHLCSAPHVTPIPVASDVSSAGALPSDVHQAR